jgi:hypothetical protein
MIALASVGGNEEKGTKQAVLIARDSQVDIALVPHADFEYANDSDSIVWTGDITNACFAITVRPAAASGSKTLRAQILVDGKPLGQIMITLTVAAEDGGHAASSAVASSLPSVPATALAVSSALASAAIASAPLSAAAATMPSADSALPSNTVFFRSTYVCHAAGTVGQDSGTNSTICSDLFTSSFVFIYTVSTTLLFFEPLSTASDIAPHQPRPPICSALCTGA